MSRKEKPTGQKMPTHIQKIYDAITDEEVEEFLNKRKLKESIKEHQKNVSRETIIRK